MFYIYHSNDLDVQKGILLELMARDNTDPFQSETILVQSPNGMARWLELQIAEAKGIAANLNFPMPARFIWQQYVDNLPNVPQQSQFHKDAMTWRLMTLIKEADVPQLNHYLQSSTQSEQQKRYQLALNIADLFDQYLVYRPDWIEAWERNDEDYIWQQIKQQNQNHNENLNAQIQQNIQWQGQLWRALIENIRQQNGDSALQHRAYLHQEYLKLLSQQKPKNLPPRLFIFGISALPKTYLMTFEAMAQYCDVHLFFNNPSHEYWADIVDPTFLQKLRLKKRENYQVQHLAQFKTKNFVENSTALFSDERRERIENTQVEYTQDDEMLQVGNPLLSIWGKLGRDFFHLLSQTNAQEIQAFTELNGDSLLRQVQRNILNLTPNLEIPLHWNEQEQSISFHACHSPMREVEILHDHLLQLFQQDPELTPKDIVVMVANIDDYQPYIQAVFGQYQHYDQQKQDSRYIPFSISDSKLSENDVLIATFLSLLKLQDNPFTAETILALLDVPAVRERFGIELEDLNTLRHWVADVGIRFGLNEQTANGRNFNAWQAGLQRMLLGFAMREENGVWQDEVAFDNSYGLKGRLVGALAAFLDRLQQWQQLLSQPHSIEEWWQELDVFVDDFFELTPENTETIFNIKDCIEQLAELLQHIEFEQLISSDVIAEVLTAKLDDENPNAKFLVGKVNFCTLLPMRAIPFKVVCLLGMNDADYPRQQTPNSFDLMQYHRQKGDRLRRDDDRYLFLEALLAAQDSLYISYVGRSVIDNQPLEPSVLISQLRDYINDNLGEKKIGVQEHSMTIFSPENFSENHRSFATEWLPLARRDELMLNDFASTTSPITQEPVTRLEFRQLVSFVINPVRYFFEKQLGVYWNNDNELIGDTENFTLNGLDRYQINEALLQYEPEQLDLFFQTLRLKGISPRGNFAQIYEDQARSDFEMYFEQLQPYLQQTPQIEWQELALSIGERNLLLSGELNQLYGAEKQRVVWRVGKMKDSFKIEHWLAYVWQVAITGRTIPPLLYCKSDNNEQLECHSFDPLEQSTARALLSNYVQSYIEGETQLQLIPTSGLDGILNIKDTDDRKNINLLNQVTENDVYWQRVLMQTQQIDWQTLLAQTQSWFGDMLALSKKC